MIPEIRITLRFTFHASRIKRGQVILRHTELTAYRCFLPDLAGFTGFRRTGPSPYLRGEESGGIVNKKLPYPLTLHASRLHLAERVGFEPTVPLLGRMLSKHVDSTTL